MSATAFLLAAVSAATIAGEHPLTPATVEKASAIAEAGMKEQQMPGLSVVVMKGDHVVLARGFGLEDTAREDRVSEHTVFALGSITKQFVAALVLQLAEEGKLGLDDSVARHLTDFTAVPPELKIRHLLSHTSGMREEFVQPELGRLFEKPGTTFGEYVDVARHSPSDWAPASRWSYGNVNYLMLTVLLERLTGEPLEKLIAERLTNPLRLESIQMCANPIGETAGHARGYQKRDGALVPQPPENISLFRGSGALCGSALDVARWTRALASGKVLSERSYRLMTTRTRLNDGRAVDYGFAMDLGPQDGVQRNGHGGYGGGFSAQAAYYPGAQLTVVVAGNSFVAFPEDIERKISRLLLRLPEPVVREVALSPKELERYAGSYDLGIHGWIVETKVRDGRLWFELAAPPISLPLVHVGKGEFVSHAPADYRLTFSKAGGRQELRLVGMGRMTWYGVRRP